MLEVAIIAALVVVGTLMILRVLVGMFRKVGPNEAMVVYGFGGTHVVCGGGTFIWPMVQSGRALSLELMSFDVAPQKDLYTNQGVGVTVEAVAQLKVKSDPESILTSAEQFLNKTFEDREALIRLVMEGHLRGIVGQLTVEQIVKEPGMIGDKMRSTCAEEMAKMGLEVVSFTIKEVRDKNDYINNMGKPDIARVKKEAEITLAKGKSEAEAMQLKARSYQDYNQAAVLDKILTGLPELAKALAMPLSKVDKITVVSQDGASSGVNRITADLSKIVAQTPALVEGLTGVRVADLLARLPAIKSAPSNGDGGRESDQAINAKPIA